MMNITKVKYAGEKVRIEYTIDRADGGEATRRMKKDETQLHRPPRDAV